jgi:ABC-type transport system involved in Fe-S cluster assembly fused permease/ATPase subunit
VLDPKKSKKFDPAKKGLVEFRDVCFRYHNAEEDAISHISFTARPGETTAIIGPTGAGKSTIASLLMRFYDATQGQVMVDGVDVREVEQKALREKIGYVPQKGVLLSGTIASNLRYGRKDASNEEIKTAARVAQAMDFIEEKPEKFNSEIAQGGSNVSGGQKQQQEIWTTDLLGLGLHRRIGLMTPPPAPTRSHPRPHPHPYSYPYPAGTHMNMHARAHLYKGHNKVIRLDRRQPYTMYALQML